MAISSQVSTQRMAIKTNTLEWLATSPNLGVKLPLSDWVIAEVSASVDPWEITDKPFYRYGRVQAEARYWLRNLLACHCTGAAEFYSVFDVGITPRAYYGDAVATGATYRYNWILSCRRNPEVLGGVGVVRYRSVCHQPGNIHGEPNEPGWALIPVKLSVSFIRIAK